MEGDDDYDGGLFTMKLMVIVKRVTIWRGEDDHIQECADDEDPSHHQHCHHQHCHHHHHLRIIISIVIRGGRVDGGVGGLLVLSATRQW
eukprot:3644885-Karenia_brevis.AAC.1